MELSNPICHDSLCMWCWSMHFDTNVKSQQCHFNCQTVTVIHLHIWLSVQFGTKWHIWLSVQFGTKCQIISVNVAVTQYYCLSIILFITCSCKSSHSWSEMSNVTMMPSWCVTWWIMMSHGESQCHMMHYNVTHVTISNVFMWWYSNVNIQYIHCE